MGMEKEKKMKPSGSTELTEEEKELIKERLRQLGYL
jgi:hypothetical protein